MTYAHSVVMVTWRTDSERRYDVIYVVDYFRSVDDDVTGSCEGRWSVNGSAGVLTTRDHQMSTLVTGLCPSTEFIFTVSRGD